LDPAVFPKSLAPLLEAIVGDLRVLIEQTQLQPVPLKTPQTFFELSAESVVVLNGIEGLGTRGPETQFGRDVAIRLSTQIVKNGSHSFLRTPPAVEW
jgi:hypothetical protein